MDLAEVTPLDIPPHAPLPTSRGNGMMPRLEMYVLKVLLLTGNMNSIPVFLRSKILRYQMHALNTPPYTVTQPTHAFSQHNHAVEFPRSLNRL